MAATSDHAKLAANTLQACNHIFLNAGFSEAQVPLVDHTRRSATNATLARVQIQLLRPVDDLSCMSLIIDGHVLDNLHFIRDMTDDGRLLFVWNGNAFFMDSDAIILHRASFTAPFFVRLLRTLSRGPLQNVGLAHRSPHQVLGSLLPMYAADGRYIAISMHGVSSSVWCFLAHRTFPVGCGVIKVGQLYPYPPSRVHWHAHISCPSVVPARSPSVLCGYCG